MTEKEENKEIEEHKDTKKRQKQEQRKPFITKSTVGKSRFSYW